MVIGARAGRAAESLALSVCRAGLAKYDRLTGRARARSTPATNRCMGLVGGGLRSRVPPLLHQVPDASALARLAGQSSWQGQLRVG